MQVLGKCSESFRSFLEEEGLKLLSRLGLEGEVVVMVYERPEELTDYLGDYFSAGYTTLVVPGGGRIIVVEENWRSRGREYWPSLLAQALVEALLPPPEVPGWILGEEAYLLYKALRNYQVHSFLASKGVYYSVKEVERMLDWVVRDISRLTPEELSEGSFALVLVIAIALSSAWPYKEVASIGGRINAVLGVLPPSWREALLEGLRGGVKELEKRLRGLHEASNLPR